MQMSVHYVRQLTCSLGALLVMCAGLPVHATVKLDPQKVVDMALSQGFSAKSAELKAQRSYLPLARAKGVFDLDFKFYPGYEYTEAQTITLSNDPADRTWSVVSSLTKRFSTGTTVEIDYVDTRLHATLNSSSASYRTPDSNLNSVQAGIRQSLWQDAFGYGDRLAIEVGEDTIKSALEQRQEDLEAVILDVMTKFWDTYIAQQQLKANIEARDKYETLVKSTRRKVGYNLSSPGELPRLEAEFENAEQRVKSSSADYLNDVDALLTAIRYEPRDQVELVIPTNLPPVPQLNDKDIESLRTVKIAKLNLDNAERSNRIVRSTTYPRLDLVARAKTTGVDEQSPKAVAEMTSGNYPDYYVGFEFETPIGSDLNRGLQADAQVAYMQAQNDYQAQRDLARDQLVAVNRNVASQYAITRSSIETVTYRERVVHEMESAYRQGRQPLVELIRSYDDLFAAQLASATAVGHYNILLNQLAAQRDELVAEMRK